MGLDVILCSNLPDKVLCHFDKELDSKENSHDLSRTFCNLMNRKELVVGEISELDQLGALTYLEVEKLYEMELFAKEQLEGMLSYPEYHSLEEIEQTKLKAAQEQEQIANNLPVILELITDLLHVLPTMEPLEAQLTPTTWDTLNRSTYFADFTKDVGKGYIGNNFGQDLRNFQRYLLYAQKHGATKVWFSYG